MQLERTLRLGKTNQEKWQAAYQGGTQPPWDCGLAHPLTLKLIEQAEKTVLINKSARILVPGTGLSHDAALLAERGYDVTALDFVPQAVSLSRQRYGHMKNLKVLRRDVLVRFDEEEPFEAIFDQGMLSALLPERRKQYLDNIRQTLRPGGVFLLISVSGLHPQMPSGPPFLLNGGELTDLFAGEFECHFRREHACFGGRVTRQMVSLWRRVEK